ncbi:hypothetical protein M9434_006756 [Picochlorum sp. BPE23]|nr:hypothetical protein M9434_006756 [Picochlorum sp. BPE23]
MFRSTYQTGFISVFYSIGSDPLQLWDSKSEDGSVERLLDEDLKSTVLELKGASVATTSIQCPRQKLGPLRSLGITLPYMVFLVKNMEQPCSFEVQVLDSKNERRRFRASTFQKKVKTNEAITAMPLKLSPGWNHVQFNLDEFLHTWYSTRYKETVQIQVHATCRLRRIYFTDVARPESDLPPEFRLFVPEK